MSGEKLLAQRTQSHEGQAASKLERLATTAIDIGFHLHRELGPGLPESVYEAIMADEFAQRGIRVQRQIVVPITYRGRIIENALRADLIVEDSLLIELKAQSAMRLFMPNKC
jgi:GxxExxY protein